MTTEHSATAFFKTSAGIPDDAPKGLPTSEQTWGHYRAEHAAFKGTDQRQYPTTKAAQQHADEICDKEGLTRVKVRMHRARQTNYSRYDSGLFVRPERKTMPVVSLGKASYNEGTLIHELAHHKHFTASFPDGEVDPESRAKFFADDEGGHGANFQQHYHQMISDHHSGGSAFANSVRDHAQQGGFWKASTLNAEVTDEEVPDNEAFICPSPAGAVMREANATDFFRQSAEGPKTYTWKGQAYGPDGGYVDKEYQVQGPLYHGGGKRWRDGQQIKPGRKPNSWGDEYGKSEHVYFTTNRDTAASYAQQSGGHVFQVEPTGDFRMDHNGDDYKTRHPLNVVRRLDPEDWNGQAEHRTAGRGRPRRQPGAGGGAAGAGQDAAGAAPGVGADQGGAGAAVGPRQVSFHPAAKKELTKLDGDSRNRVASTINALQRGDENLQTHALKYPLKGWNSTKATRGHRVIHRDLDDGTLHIGYVGLHDYDRAINRLTSLTAFFERTSSDKLMRGLNVVLPPHIHDAVHDESQPLPARAHLLLSELKKPTSAIDGQDMHGAAGGLGEFWTRSHTVSDDAAAYQDERRPAGQNPTTVTLHTEHPGPQHFWHEMAGVSHDHSGNYRVPLRPGTDLGIHAITWSAPGGGQHHYEFSKPVHKQAADTLTDRFRQTAAVDDDDDYRMQHRAPGPENAPLHDPTRPSAEGGRAHEQENLDNPDWGAMGEPHEESLAAVHRAKGDPEAPVTVYRAVPHGITSIRTGDWVSTSSEHARNEAASGGSQEHGGEDNPEHDWPVLKATVPAKHVHTDGNDINEWGYNGPHIENAAVHGPDEEWSEPTHHTAARTPYTEDTSDDRPVTFKYHRNTEGAGHFGETYGQHIEPHGRYVSQGALPEHLADDPRYESGTLTFQRPLRVHMGGGYGEPSNWKHQVSTRYQGKTGRELSQAVRDDGYDGIMTHDEYGPSETVDLTHLAPRHALSATAFFQLQTEAAAVSHDDGVMVAFVPPREVAEQIAHEDGQPVEELHITLAYLGNEADYTPEQLQILPQVVSSWAVRQKPLDLRIGGVGKFSNPSEDQHVLWASVDIPGGAQLHADLARYLEGHGFRLPSEHGWNPHMTLKYVDQHYRFMPHLPELRWTANSVDTFVGPTRHVAHFGTVPSGENQP
ncbi:NAD(+)--rifampin ADP-ribosyltransferase [Streptomyces sp. cg35]|uniref:NAD(+)--rifampin ADP-ribosyltransferase n=1 Tax=Streptomyces sp. cg35 TaxID=3421650 RepID=UPI003D176966